jgi:hypothetical protein
VQRTVLYLGEINDQQQGAWRTSLSVFDEQQQDYANLSLFPDDREIPADAIDSTGLRSPYPSSALVVNPAVARRRQSNLPR